MEFRDRQFLRVGGRQIALAVLACASLSLASAGAAQPKSMLGTPGADRMVGTATADVIKARAGNDRIEARGGPDRLSGGRGSDRLFGGSGRDRVAGGPGADRLDTVDGRADGAVVGGPGRDICRMDAADEARANGCEIVRIVSPDVPGVPGAPAVPGPMVCAAPPEDAALARVAQDDDPPAVFSAGFYAVTTTITASADGLTGTDLPISIEGVCDVPRSLATEAAQLVGGDGVAVITPTSQVFDAAGALLAGEAATDAVDEADTVVLKAQLVPPDGWRQDEDGAPVPTFSVSRADVTD